MGLYSEFEENGDMYMSFDNSAAEDFVLWGSPPNQAVIKDIIGRLGSTYFDFMAPLSRRDAAFQFFDFVGEERGDYFYCIDRVSDFLDDIGILYASFEPECEFAIVACSKSYPNASRLPELLEKTHLPLLRLKGRGSSLQWERVGDWSQVK